MKVEKILTLRFSGQGENAIHKKVIQAFSLGEDEGKKYCIARGYEANIKHGILTVYSPAMFGFEMKALVTP